MFHVSIIILMTFTTTHMAKHVVKIFAIFLVLAPKIKKAYLNWWCNPNLVALGQSNLVPQSQEYMGLFFFFPLSSFPTISLTQTLTQKPMEIFQMDTWHNNTCSWTLCLKSAIIEGKLESWTSFVHKKLQVVFWCMLFHLQA